MGDLGVVGVKGWWGSRGGGSLGVVGSRGWGSRGGGVQGVVGVRGGGV